LGDQFDSLYSDEDFRGKILVLIGSDRGGSEYNGRWGAAIYNDLEGDPIRERVSWLGVADVSNVPSFMRGFVRGFFPKEKEEWVALDWEGLFPETYWFEEDMSNILVFDQSGRLVYRGTGTDVKKEQVDEIVQIIKGLNN